MRFLQGKTWILEHWIASHFHSPSRTATQSVLCRNCKYTHEGKARRLHYCGRSVWVSSCNPSYMGWIGRINRHTKKKAFRTSEKRKEILQPSTIQPINQSNKSTNQPIKQINHPPLPLLKDHHPSSNLFCQLLALGPPPPTARPLLAGFLKVPGVVVSKQKNTKKVTHKPSLHTCDVFGDFFLHSASRGERSSEINSVYSIPLSLKFRPHWGLWDTEASAISPTRGTECLAKPSLGINGKKSASKEFLNSNSLSNSPGFSAKPGKTLKVQV